MNRSMRRRLARELGMRDIGSAREATTTVADCACPTFEEAGGDRITLHWPACRHAAMMGRLERF